MRRFWLACVLALAGVATWAVRPGEHVRVVRTSSVQIVPMPAPIAIVSEVEVPVAPATCPPPRTDAKLRRPAKLPEAIDHVRPSVTNAGWIAAWNAKHIYISTDGGASWQRRLDAASPVQDVAFDCFGRPIAMRANFVGIRDGEAEHWRPVPSLRQIDPEVPMPARLLGGGPDIVVVAHAEQRDDRWWVAQLGVSHDLGATWRTRRLVDDWEGGHVHGRQHEDGTVLAMLSLPDCMSDFPFAFRWKDGVYERLETSLDADLAFFGDRMVSYRGSHKIGSDYVRELPDLGAPFPTLIEGPYPIFITDAGAFRVDRKRVTRLPVELDGDETDLVADPAGRLWSVRCGKPHVSTKTAPAACPVPTDR